MENNPTGNIGRVNGTEMRSPSALPLPGSNAYGDLPQFPKHGVLPFRRTIRRHELRQIVPLPKRRSTKWSVAASSHGVSI